MEKTSVPMLVKPAAPPANATDEGMEWDEPIGIVLEAARSGFDGDVMFVGETFRAKICLARGRIAWARCSTHGEFFSAFLREKTGLSEQQLQSALGACQTSGRRFGEELVARGAVDRKRLRACLAAHVANHLWALAHTQGDFEIDYVERRYRYDDRLTFSPTELLTEALTSTVARIEGAKPKLPYVIVSVAGTEPLASGNGADGEHCHQAMEFAARRSAFGTKVGEQVPGPALFNSTSGAAFAQPLTLWSGLTAVVFAPPQVSLGALLGVAQSCLPSA